MSYYVRVIYDWLDDQWCYHMIVSFSSKKVAGDFKNELMSRNISGVFIAQSSDKQWLKEYLDIPLVWQPKPAKITEEGDIENVVNFISEKTKKLPSREIVKNDFLLIFTELLVNMYDECELFLMDVVHGAYDTEEYEQEDLDYNGYTLDKPYFWEFEELSKEDYNKKNMEYERFNPDVHLMIPSKIINVKVNFIELKKYNLKVLRKYIMS